LPVLPTYTLGHVQLLQHLLTQNVCLPKMKKNQAHPEGVGGGKGKGCAPPSPPEDTNMAHCQTTQTVQTRCRQEPAQHHSCPIRHQYPNKASVQNICYCTFGRWPSASPAPLFVPPSFGTQRARFCQEGTPPDPAILGMGGRR